MGGLLHDLTKDRPDRAEILVMLAGHTSNAVTNWPERYQQECTGVGHLFDGTVESEESSTKETAYIVNRVLRTLRKKGQG